MDSDNEWFRGSGEQQRTNLRTAIQTAERRDDSLLFDSMFIGVAAYKVMRGAAATPDEIGGLLAMMIADCEIAIRDHSLTMLAQTDLNTPEAREAHFNARVAAKMIGMLNEYVQRGAAATDAINNTTARAS